MGFWRETLIVTGGSTPQVVTETIYALASRQIDPIVPSKIICVVTKGVADVFESQLENALSRLKQQLSVSVDWDRRERSWCDDNAGLFVEFPRNQDGSSVEDIRTEIDAVQFGDLISEIVRTETLDDRSRVHLSLAGGRKTMSFQGGAAMSLFGRAQDELSHVLVHPSDFEGCSEFWFPSTTPTLVKHNDGRALDASQATIEFALIPFIRVRDRLPDELLHKRLDYAANVAQTNAVLGRVPLFLELVTSERRVRIGNLVDFTLSNTEFALYQLMAEWKLHGYKGAGLDGIGDDHIGWLTARMFEHPAQYQPNPVKRFIDIYADTFKSGTERSDGMLHLIIPHPLDDSQRKGNERTLGQWKARLFRTLQEHLRDVDLADRFGAPRLPIKVLSEINGRRSNRVVFGLKLEPREIIIRPD